MVKPYLIMIPGWGMKSFVWNNINKFLSKDFELIVIEWDNILSLKELKGIVIKIIEQRQLSSFSLLGWSLGSLVAQDIVSDNLWNINHLILIGGTSSFVQHIEDGYNIGWNKRIVERMKSQLYKKPQQTLSSFYNSMFSTEEKLKGYNNQFLEVTNKKIEDSSIDSLALGLDYLIQKDLRDKLSNITIPTLLIHGEEDSICPLESSLYIKNIVSSSNIKIISKAGHIPFFTNPSDCSNAICKFTKNI